MGIYPDIEPCCPRFHRSTPKGPTATALYFLRTQLPAYGLPEPKYGHNYYKLSLKERIKDRPEMQGLVDEVHDALRSYLLKITGIETASALIHLTAGVIQIISSSVALKKSSSFESALHITSIITGALSIISAIIQGIAIPPLVKKTFDKVTKAVSDTVEIVVDYANDNTITPREARKILNPLHLLATGTSQQGLATTQSTTSVVTTPVSPAAVVAPATPVVAVPGLSSVPVSATPSQTSIQSQPTILSSPILPLPVQAVAPAIADTGEPTDNRVRHQVGVHHCTSSCKTIVINSGADKIRWYTPTDWEDTIRLIFSVQNSQYHADIAKMFPDKQSLLKIGIEFFDTAPSCVEGCTRNAIFERGHELGLSDQFHHRPIAPGYAYKEGKIAFYPWALGLHNIRKATDHKIYWDPDMEESYPFISVKFGKSKDVIQSLASLKRLSYDDASTQLNTTSWVCNHTLDKGSLKNHPGPFFLTPATAQMFSCKNYKGHIVYPYVSQPQAKQDWSKLIIGLITTTLCAVGVGLSPGRNDIMKWISGANQGASMIKNASQAQDFIVNQLAGMETAADEELEKRYKDLCLEADNILAIPPGVFTVRVDLIDRYDSWSNAFDRFMRDAKSSKSKAVNWYVRTLQSKQSKLSELWVSVNQCFHSSKKRTPTVLIELTGAPGIGKTTSIEQFIVPDLAKMMGNVSPECFHWQINHNGHVNVYGGEIFSSYDEFRARGSDDPMFQYLNHIASSPAFLVPSAFDKSRNFLSRVLFLTSNSGKTDLKDLVTAEAERALNSRVKTYRLEHPEAEALMKNLQTREVICDRSPDTFNYYRKIHSLDANGHPRDIETKISYKDFLIDIYTMMWQQHNNHPPMAVDDNVRALLSSWTGIKEPTFSEDHRVGRTVPMSNDTIPPLQKRLPEEPINFSPQGSQPQGGVEHFIVNIRGTSGRGKTHFMNEVAHLFPRLVHTHIKTIDLKNSQTWGQAFAYWIDDQVIANQDAYLDFYNQLTQPSVIFITSNLKVRNKKLGLRESLRHWWTGAPCGRVLEQITVEGIKRRLGLSGVLLLDDNDTETVFSSVGTFIEAEIERPGFLKIEEEVCSKDKFIIRLGEAIKNWREHELLYSWGDDVGVEIPVDPDICIKAQSWASLKVMLTNGTSMWNNLTYSSGGKDPNYLFIKPELADKLKKKNEIVVDFWKLHPSINEDQQEFAIEAIFTTYRQVDSSSTLLLHIGDSTYWNRDQCLYKRGRSHETALYKEDGDNITIFFNNKAELVHQVTVSKSEYVHAVCEGLIHSTTLLQLTVARQDIVLRHADYILGLPYMTPYVAHHLETIQVSWYTGIWTKAKRMLKKMWKEHPIFLVAGVLCTIWVGWKGLTSLYNSVKTCITGITEWRCPCCSYLHAFTREQRKCFLTPDYKYCPNCRTKYALTHEGELLSVHRLCEQTRTWQDETFHQQAKREVKCPIAENQSPTSLADNDTAWRSGKNGTVRAARWQKRPKSNPNKYAPPLADAGVPTTFSDAWIENWEEPNDNWEFQGKQDHYHAVLKAVKENMCSVTGVSTTKAMFIKDKYVIYPWHAHEDTGMTVKVDGKYWDIVPVYCNSNADIAISKVVDKRFPARKDITRYMLPASQVDKISSGMIVIYDDHGYDSISGSLRFVQECHSHYFSTTDQKVDQNLLMLNSVSMATGGLHPEVGDCGNPYIAMTGNAQCLVGYHISYAHHTSTAYAAALIRENIIDILADYETRVFQSGEKSITSFRVPFGQYYATDDFLTYIDTIRPEDGNVILPENRCVTLGKGPKATFPRKNSMYKKTPFSSVIEQKLPIEKIPVSANMQQVSDFSDLMKNRKGQYCFMTTQMASCTSEFKADVEVLERAENIVSQLMQAYYGKDHRMLNQHEVLNGIPGISPVTLDTGAGIICEKSHKIMLKRDAITYDGVYKFRDNEKGNALRARFKHDVNMFEQDKAPAYLFKAELKSECLPIDKAKRGKIRLFNNAGTELLLIERKMSGDISASVAQKPGPIFIGKDPLLHFNEYFKQLLFTHHIDVDVKRWDKSVLPAFIARSLRILSKMHRDPKAERWYTTLFKIIGYPLVQFDETFAQLIGTIPSGMYHTALLGSVCHMLICTYALLRALPEGMNPLHGGYFLTCADDLVYLHDGKDIDMEIFRAAYRECGIEIQHPDKVGGLIRSAPASDPILFCSRTIRKEDGRWFPALNWSSLTSCLHFTKEKGQLGLENILAVVRCESYALERKEYEKIREILFDIYVFLSKAETAASLPEYGAAHLICRNFISGLIEDRSSMLAGYSSNQTVNKTFSVDSSIPQGKPKPTVRVHKVPDFSSHHHPGRMGTEHPRTRFLQSGNGSIRNFEEHIKAVAGRFECSLTIEGKTYNGNGSSYAVAGRAAWDRYEHARPAPSVPLQEEVVTIPASNLHPKTRCNTIFQRTGHARPATYSFATSAGWTTNIEQDGNTVVRTGRDKKTSEFLAWDIYYVSLCKKNSAAKELDEYLATGFSRAKSTPDTSVHASEGTSSTPQADAPASHPPYGPWTLGSFRGQFLNSHLYGASIKEIEASFLAYIMERYRPGHVPQFEFVKLKTAVAMTARRNFPVAHEEELKILVDMSCTKCDYELQLWTKLANELTDQQVSRLFHLHDTYSTPQGDNQYDMPPVPSSYLPLATTRGIVAPMTVPAMGVPSTMLAYGGVSSDIIDIMNREIWSPCTSISPSDPAGTVLLNISWEDNTNWGITQFISLHKKAAGEIYVTILISGANQCTGLLRGGLLMENIASPTIADLECAQNITLGLNGDQTMTFPLKFVSDSKFFMDTSALPDYPRIVLIQESPISNMYGSTSPAAQLKWAFDASSREMSPEGKYVKNNAGLSLVVADCRPPTTSVRGSVSATGVSMKDIFPGMNFLNMCTDGRTSYSHNTIDITKRPVLPASMDMHSPHVDTTAVNFLQDYYDGTNTFTIPIGTFPSMRDVRAASGTGNLYDQEIVSSGDGASATYFILKGQAGIYTGTVQTTGAMPWSLAGIHTSLTESELQNLASDKLVFTELNGSQGADVKVFLAPVTVSGFGYNPSGVLQPFSVATNANVRYIRRNGCGFYSIQISEGSLTGISLKSLRPCQGPTQNIPIADGAQLSTTATTTSIERNAAILTVSFGSALATATSSTGEGATSLPPQYAIIRFLDTVPALVQTANGQSFQASVHAEHLLKQWLIQHTNARDGDILHFNLGRKGFAESIADVRMMVLDTVAASYLVIKGSQQYSWFGGVMDTWIRNLIKVNSAALLPTTDQSSWQSMMVSGSFKDSFSKKLERSPRNIASLIASDPAFLEMTRKYTSMPQSGMTRREVAEVNLGKTFSPRVNQWKRRQQTVEKYHSYRTAPEEQKTLVEELMEAKADVELSLPSQELYRVMQAHLVARHDTDHDPMIRNDAWKTSLYDSASTINKQLSVITQKLDTLVDLLALSSSLLKPAVKDAITQAGLGDSKEVSVQRPKGKRTYSVPQAEVAAMAFSGFAQGIGGGVSKYYDRKFQRKMLEQSWENATEMQKLKGKQALQQDLLKGGLQYKASQLLQQRNFENQVELTGMQGASRLAMSRQTGVNQLNVEKYKKTGTTTDPPGPTSDASTTMHHDMGVGTAPKKQAPSPPTTTSSSVGTDELEHNFTHLVSNGMMTQAPSSAENAETSMPLASTSTSTEVEV